jgi:hypothetical protein
VECSSLQDQQLLFNNPEDHLLPMHQLDLLPVLLAAAAAVLEDQDQQQGQHSVATMDCFGCLVLFE